MAVTRREIGDLLVDNGVISADELELARKEHAETGEPIALVLERMGLATESALKNALELEFGVNFVPLSKYELDVALLRLLPDHVIRDHMVVPIAQEGNRLTIAMVDPSDSDATAAIKNSVDGMMVKTVVCLEDDFLHFVPETFRRPSMVTMEINIPKDALIQGESETNGVESEEVFTSVEDTGSYPKYDDTVYEKYATEDILHEIDDTGHLEPVATSSSKEVDTGQFPTLDPAAVESMTASNQLHEEQHLADLSELHLARKAQEEAIVLLANQILGGAIKKHCSNVHITPGSKQALVTYRFNGQLYVDRRLPNTILDPLIARFKMMARMDITETAVPQDGHIKVKSASKEIVCLVSTVPTGDVENLVIWIV